MVGSQRPLVLHEEDFARKLQRPETRAALERVGLGSFAALLARYTAGPDELRAFVGEGEILTDDRPLTEFFLALPQNDRPIDRASLRGDVARHVRRR